MKKNCTTTSTGPAPVNLEYVLANEGIYGLHETEYDTGFPDGARIVTLKHGSMVDRVTLFVNNTYCEPLAQSAFTHKQFHVLKETLTITLDSR